MNVDAITDAILGHAGEWWTYVITGLLCWVDGFFPPLPSESIVIAMASMALHGEQGVNLWILVPLVMVGAWLGDNTAYWIGRLIPLRRWLKGARFQQAFAKADELLDRKAAEVLLTARFIPIYRVAINMTAGGIGFPWKRFWLIDAGSTLMWTAFCIAIGTAAGAMFHDHPLLGIVAGVVLGMLLGWLVDKVATAWRQRRAEADSVPESQA